MGFKFKGNFKKVRESLQRKNGIVRGRAKKGLLFGMRLFESKIIKEQMTGRKSPSFGLNVITGNLRRSWITTPTDTLEDFIVRLGTTAPYAAIHQFGGVIANGFGKGIPIKIPKRLHVLEDFKTSGLSLIRESVSNEIKKFL